MNLDNGLWIASLSVEAVLVSLLVYRRAWRTIPIFCAFCIWEILSNAGGFVVLHDFRTSYPLYYLLSAVIDSMLEFGVLVELSWSVLRPIRASLPKRTPLVIGILVLLLGAAIWPFAGLQSLATMAPAIRTIVHLQQTTSVLRVLFFVAIAGCSQLLSIGWRDRELQVATGLGFYSLVSLATAMMHTHQSTWAQYRNLNQILLGSYICSLGYWAFCFAQKEAERREFTPQMQNLLLAVAGVARAERTALTAASSGGRHPKGE
jgi:hypothetical protein